MALKTWTVIAIYADNFAPYAVVVQAETPDEAADLAQKICAKENNWKPPEGATNGGTEPLIVAGVMEGEFEVF